MYSIDQLRIFTEPQQGATYDDLLAVALLAEQLGFGAFFRSDHYLAMGGPLEAGGLPGPTDAWTTLAGLARETSTIRLGTLVSSATFRLPGPLAITVAQVDEMSGGRVELGLGAGWYEQEHEAYAIPFPPLGERFDRLEEQLAVITGLWATPVGGRFSYNGDHYQVTDSPALPKPVQEGGVPIIIGGGGAKRTPALAARYAAEYNTPFVSVERFVEQRDARRRRPARRSTGTRPRSGTPPPPSSASAPTRPSTRGGRRRSAASPTSCAATASPARPTRSRAALAALGRRRRRAPVPPGPRPRRPRPPRRHRRAGVTCGERRSSGIGQASRRIIPE